MVGGGVTSAMIAPGSRIVYECPRNSASRRRAAAMAAGQLGGRRGTISPHLHRGLDRRRRLSACAPRCLLPPRHPTARSSRGRNITGYPSEAVISATPTIAENEPVSPSPTPWKQVREDRARMRPARRPAAANASRGVMGVESGTRAPLPADSATRKKEKKKQRKNRTSAPASGC